jgi:hypothetical protein
MRLRRDLPSRQMRLRPAWLVRSLWSLTFAFTRGLLWSHVPTKDIEHPMRGDAGRLQVLRFAQDDSTYFVAKANSPCGAGE